MMRDTVYILSELASQEAIAASTPKWRRQCRLTSRATG